MRRALPLAASLVIAVMSCQSGADVDANDRAIAIYSAVIRTVATHDGRSARNGPVFVLAADARAPISLEVQAGIVEELHGFATIRFADERGEATNDADPAKPVLDNGVLVTLGRIPPGARRVIVRAERYERTDVAVITYQVALTQNHTGWKTVGAPTVPPS